MSSFPWTFTPSFFKLEHEFYFSIYWEFHTPNWRTHIFQRGRSTTNQLIYCSLVGGCFSAFIVNLGVRGHGRGKAWQHLPHARLPEIWAGIAVVLRYKRPNGSIQYCNYKGIKIWVYIWRLICLCTPAFANKELCSSRFIHIIHVQVLSQHTVFKNNNSRCPGLAPKETAMP